MSEPDREVEVDDVEDVAEEIDSLEDLEDAEFSTTSEGDNILSIY